VTGAADAALVLNRDAKGTILYGRGWDIEEIETAMRFDGDRWSILGDADEVRKSDERRKIVAALREADDELTPTASQKPSGPKSETSGFCFVRWLQVVRYCSPEWDITPPLPRPSPSQRSSFSNLGYSGYFGYFKITRITRVNRGLYRTALWKPGVAAIATPASE